MEMKDSDTPLCTQMTVERAVFAFMLQLSFHRNSLSTALTASYHHNIYAFHFSDIEWGFPRQHKATDWSRQN